MKRKILAFLLTAMIVITVFTGCSTGSSGSSDLSDLSEDIGEGLNIITEAEEPKSVEGYFEENHLVVEGAGVSEENTVKKVTYSGVVIPLNSLGMDKEPVDCELVGVIGIREEINGDVKTITAQINPVWEYDEKLAEV